MTIIRSRLLDSFPNIVCGFSTKIGTDCVAPYYFNLSMSVGDDRVTVQKNREDFASELGLSWNSVALQKQIHGDTVRVIDSPGYTGESDAIICAKPGVGLAVSSGDCCAIFLYDKGNNVIAGVHSGWRGTEQRILEKTLQELQNSFSTKPENLYVFVAPAISQPNYQVGPEVASRFSGEYISEKENKLFLDVTLANYDMLKAFGIPVPQIEISNLCTYEMNDLLHSYRRDGAVSGRAYGIIYRGSENV